MNRQELVEKMCEVYHTAEPMAYTSNGMGAALSVAIEEMLKDPTHEEIAKMSGYGSHAYFLESRRAKLERVKTPEERVQVVRLPRGADVLLDAEWQLHFDSDSQAEIYRLGLIQQLKEQLPKNQ